MQNWEKLKEKNIKVGFRAIVKKTFRFPNGKVDVYDIKKESPVVCILAITKEHKVILARQYRPGPERILLEMPGGGIDKNESPTDAAKRELLEETGYTGDIKLVCTSFDCAYSTLERYNFVAVNCEKVREQKLEKNEFAEAVLLAVIDFKKLLRSGQLTDIESGYLGLDYLGLL